MHGESSEFPRGECLADDTTGLMIGGMVALLIDSDVIQGPNFVLA